MFLIVALLLALSIPVSIFFRLALLLAQLLVRLSVTVNVLFRPSVEVFSFHPVPGPVSLLSLVLTALLFVLNPRSILRAIQALTVPLHLLITQTRLKALTMPWVSLLVLLLVLLVHKFSQVLLAPMVRPLLRMSPR